MKSSGESPERQEKIKKTGIEIDRIRSSFVKDFMEVIMPLTGFFDHNDLAVMIKPYLSILEEKDLIYLGCQGEDIGEAVAEHLIPQIKTLDFEGRLKLGEKFNNWRIWRKIIQVPGLSMPEIRNISNEQNGNVEGRATT